MEILNGLVLLALGAKESPGEPTPPGAVLSLERTGSSLYADVKVGEGPRCRLLLAFGLPNSFIDPERAGSWWKGPGPKDIAFPEGALRSFPLIEGPLEGSPQFVGALGTDIFQTAVGIDFEGPELAVWRPGATEEDEKAYVAGLPPLPGIPGVEAIVVPIVPTETGARVKVVLGGKEVQLDLSTSASVSRLEGKLPNAKPVADVSTDASSVVNSVAFMAATLAVPGLADTPLLFTPESKNLPGTLAPSKDGVLLLDQLPCRRIVLDLSGKRLVLERLPLVAARALALSRRIGFPVYPDGSRLRIGPVRADRGVELFRRLNGKEILSLGGVSGSEIAKSLADGGDGFIDTYVRVAKATLSGYTLQVRLDVGPVDYKINRE